MVENIHLSVEMPPRCSLRVMFGGVRLGERSLSHALGGGRGTAELENVAKRLKEGSCGYGWRYFLWEEVTVGLSLEAGQDHQSDT